MSRIKLNEFIFKLNQPCVFNEILFQSEKTNSARLWTHEFLASLFKDQSFTFRIGRKYSTDIQFENECKYIEATIHEFNIWNKTPIDSLDKSNPFSEWDRNEFWAYADYKYLLELLESNDNFLDKYCIDWSEFGFDKRNANDSTMWLGSQGAYTPCHFDTYGYNLVAQIHGIKRWIMFPKDNTKFMYPTRIPFEESTVYSQVNIQRPNLQRFPFFENVKPYIIELKPGDVLYVPHNWWHFVETVSDSISINTWVELKAEDTLERLKEITSKTLLQSVMESNFIGFEKWINSSEDYQSQENNVQTIVESYKSIGSDESVISPINDHELNLVKNHLSFSCLIDHISFDDYISTYTTLSNEKMSKKFRINEEKDCSNILKALSNAVTDPDVMELIVKKFIHNLKI